MAEVTISRKCYEMISGKKINYLINEILGYVDYSYSSKLVEMPFCISDKNVQTIEVEDSVMSDVRKNFKAAKDINGAVEYLLWSYLLLGKNL